jgi:release factor glutamine methyltransferase
MKNVQAALANVLRNLIVALLDVCEGEREATAEAWLLLAHVTGLSRSALLAQPVCILTIKQDMALQEMLVQRVQHRKPLQYLLGSAPFLDVTITVRPPMLIPRPETEEWVAWLLGQLSAVKDKPLRILDLCTGTGCIALALAKGFPNAEVFGIDIVPEAVLLAQENAAQNAITNVKFVCADLWAGVPKGVFFDLVVSNPPYITEAEFGSLAPEVALWEDKRALVAAESGLAVYRALAASLMAHLDKKSIVAQNGLPSVVVELGSDSGSVESMFMAAGLAKASLNRDLHGFYRWLSGQI